VRRAALAELIAAGRVGEALDANPAIALDKIDPVQRILSAVHTGSLPPVWELRLEELTTLQRIAPWMEKLDLRAPFPPAQEIRRYLEREQLLDPFRHLIGGWEDGVFVEHFRGRQRELRRLREYVDVAKSEGLRESAARAFVGVGRYLLHLHERPPLVIHGPGGVGKSTLWPNFCCNTWKLGKRSHFHSSTSISTVRTCSPQAAHAPGGDRMSARRAGPARQEALLDFRQHLQDGARATTLQPGSSYLSVPEYLQPIYGAEPPPAPRFRHLRGSPTAQPRLVRGLFDFLDRLQGAVPRLRTVLVGRAPVTEEEVKFRAENLPLLDLDAEAARGFLQSRGIRDEQVATEIIGLTGGNPLALKLAADLVRERSIAEVREALEAPV
jgi:hypothetical protein